jgi:hypothetical protein
MLGGLLSLGYTSARTAGMPGLPDLPAVPDPPSLGTSKDVPDDFSDIPAVPDPPSLEELLRQAAAPAPGNNSPLLLPPSTSYAGTIDTGVACLPCFRRHVSTATTAAEHAAAAAARGDTRQAREESVRAAGEVLLFGLYDYTPQKIAATDPATMGVIDAALPTLLQAAEALPQPPLPALAGWASVNEAVRFARSEEPDAGDTEQIALRLRPALRWLDETESLLLAPERTAALPPAQRQAARTAADELRQARHYLAPGGAPLTADGLEQASAHFFAAAVALTPPPTPGSVEQARALAAEARDALDDHLMARMRAGR